MKKGGYACMYKGNKMEMLVCISDFHQFSAIQVIFGPVDCH